MHRGILQLGLFLSLVAAVNVGTALSQDAKAGAEKPIEGTLKIGGKTYKLMSVVVYEAKLFDDLVTVVMASNKTIPVNQLKAALAKDGTDDSFTFWEPNIRVNFNAEGKPTSLNAWADNTSVSVSGSPVSGELTIKDGVARGKMTLAADDDGSRGCEFTFAAPVFANPAAKKAVDTKPDEPANKTVSSGSSNANAGPGPNVYKLPLPKDAANVEYKELVEQLTFTSKTDHKSLAKSFAQELAAAGWKTEDSDLIAAASAILKRTKDGAELTIFVKPADSGCTVLMMTEGMSWQKP